MGLRSSKVASRLERAKGRVPKEEELNKQAEQTSKAVKGHAATAPNRNSEQATHFQPL